jgi:hypothetical protein
MVVYVIMSGDHDLYGMDEVFSTREKAEAYIQSKEEYYAKHGPPAIIEKEVDPDSE